jgi:hypothetical protein
MEVGTRVLGNIIKLPCFFEHMMDANNLMTELYMGEQLLRLSLAIREFMQEVITLESIGPSCNELGRIIYKLIIIKNIYKKI